MNFRRSFVLAAAVAFVISACSQHSDLTSPVLEPQFGSVASDRAFGVAKHSSGVYVVGDTSGNLHAANKGSNDAYIRKYNTSGKLLWGRQFGTNASDNAFNVAADANNNVYVLGTTLGSLARPLRGPSDLFLRKYTSSGNIAWTRQMGLDNNDSPGGVAVSGGFVYVVGSDQDLGTVVYRFNANGGTSWKRQLGTGGAGDIAVDGSGNVYVAGAVAAYCDYWDCTDVQLNKYNASGTLVWSKRLDYTEEDSVIALAAHGSSVYLAMEQYYATDDDSLTYLIKLNASGVPQWDKGISFASRYDPPTNLNTDISADASGVFTASTRWEYSWHDDTYVSVTQSVAKFSTNGSLAWRVGKIDDYDSSVGGYIPGSFSGIVAHGGELYVVGTLGSGDRGNEAQLKRFNATNGRTVWQR